MASRNLSFLIIVVLVSLGIVVPLGWTSSSTRLPCPLIWTQVSLGDYPPDVVPVSDSLNPESHLLVARSHYEGKYVTGFVNESTGFGHFGKDGKVTKYDVLTNPHGCILAWSPNQADEFRVETAEGQTPKSLVGRGALGDLENRWAVSGDIVNVDGESPEISLPGSDTGSNDFTTLTSFSNGVKCQAVDFKFEDTNPQLRPELVGIDEIWNDSPATIVQVLTHRTVVTDRTSVTSSSYSKSSFGFSIGIKLPIPTGGKGDVSVGISYDYKKMDGEEHSSTTVHEEERELNFTRQIKLPPFTNAQACSLVSMLEDFNASYTGELHYSAPGLSLADVRKILETEGIVGGTDDELRGVIVVKTEGSLAATMAINTDFIVVPVEKSSDGTTVGGCTEIQAKSRKIQEINQGLRENALLTPNEKYEKIQRILDEISYAVKKYKR